MKKSIEQKRDELALEHFKEVNPHLSNQKDIEYYGNYEKSQTMRAYREGFDSGYKLAEERAAENLRKASLVIHDLSCTKAAHSEQCLYFKNQLRGENEL